MSIINNIVFSILIFVIFTLGFINYLIKLIDTGDLLILLMLEVGFLALINKEND